MHRAINVCAMKISTMQQMHRKIQIANPLNVALNCINWAIYNWAVFPSISMMVFAVHSNSSVVRIILTLSNLFSVVCFQIIIIIIFSSTARDDEVIEAGDGPKSDNTCKYGNMTLNVGDKIKVMDPCLECSCETPPMARCIRIITTEKCH